MTSDSDPAEILAVALQRAHVIARARGVARLLGPDGIDSAAGLAAANSIARWDANRGGHFDGYLTVNVFHQLIDDTRKLYGRRRRVEFVQWQDESDDEPGREDFYPHEVDEYVATISPDRGRIYDVLNVYLGTAGSRVEVASVLGVDRARVAQLWLRLEDDYRCWLGERECARATCPRCAPAIRAGIEFQKIRTRLRVNERKRQERARLRAIKAA